MSDQQQLINDIDALLPQTQCGLCEYDGCKPYATAIATQSERIDKCLPGGVATLKKLGNLVQQDPTPYIEEMQDKAKPALLAVIREDECIGCTKCIQACPVDAIIGASKQMHSIINDACTGCELCIEPCPVDCIDLVELPERNEAEQQQLADQSRQRYTWLVQRTQRDQLERKQKHDSAKLNTTPRDTVAARKDAIAAALARVKAKKK